MRNACKRPRPSSPRSPVRTAKIITANVIGPPLPTRFPRREDDGGLRGRLPGRCIGGAAAARLGVRAADLPNLRIKEVKAYAIASVRHCPDRGGRRLELQFVPGVSPPNGAQPGAGGGSRVRAGRSRMRAGAAGCGPGAAGCGRGHRARYPAPAGGDYAGCFLRGRETRFFGVPSPEVLRGARGRRCGLGGNSGMGISPVAVGCPGTRGCGSSSSSSST